MEGNANGEVKRDPIVQKLHYWVMPYCLILYCSARTLMPRISAALRRLAVRRLANQLRLYVGCGRPESHAKMARYLVTDVGQMSRQMLRVDRVPLRSYYEALYDIAQFAHVSRPGVC